MFCRFILSVLLVILTATSAFTQTVVAPTKGLWDQYPVSHAFKLSNGNLVTIPYRGLTDYVAVIGAVNTAKLNQLLAKEDLISVPLNAAMQPDPNGFSLVTVYVLKYKQSSLGPYNEIVISTLTQSTSPMHTAKVGYFCLEIKVDQDDALRMGREYFGLLKTMAIFDTRFEKDIQFNVTAASEQRDFNGFCKNCSELPSNLMPLTFFFISPFEIRRTWYEFSNLGQVAIKPFDAQNDRFELGDSGTAQLLKNLEFFPVSWMVGKDIYLIVSGGN